jgi:hypothetical protein
MQNTNLSQIHVTVQTEVVPSFFINVTQPAQPGEIQIGKQCFIYDDDFKPTKAVCIDVSTEHTHFRSIHGDLFTVANIEPPLNPFEFNRLLGIKLKSSDPRTGYEKHVINRAVGAKVILPLSKGEHKFTEYGRKLANAHLCKDEQTTSACLLN